MSQIFRAPTGRLFACVVGLVGGMTFGTGAATAEVVDFFGQEVLVSETFAGDPVLDPPPPVVMVGDNVELENFGFLDFDIDLGANSIGFLANEPLSAGGGLFGFSFEDAGDMIDMIAGVTIASNEGFDGFGPGNISFDADEIVVDFTGVAYEADSTLLLDVSFRDPTAVIPLPASLPLVLGGVAALGIVGRRRRTG